MATNEQSPSVAAAQQAKVLAAVLFMFGLALLITGPVEVRLAGLCLLAAAGEARFAGPITPWVSAFSARLTVLASAIGGQITRRLPWVFGGVGAIVALATVRSWQSWPAPIPHFYLGISALFIAAAAYWERDDSSHGASARFGAKLVCIVGAIAGAAAAAGLASVTLLYGANIPFFDEYITTLPFVLDFSGMTTSQRMAELIRPHFGHRIVSTRAIALAQRALLGNLDFYQLLLISFGFFSAAIALVYGSLRAPIRNMVLFAPFLLLVCHPQFHQLTLWAFSLPHFSALFFSALAFLLLSRGGNIELFVAMLAAIAAAFSFASGVLVGIIGLAYLVDQRRYAHAHIWLVPMAFTLVWYFRGIENLSTLEGLVKLTRHEPDTLGKIVYLLEFLGSAATLGVFTDFWSTLYGTNLPHPHTARLAQGAGLLLLVVFLYLSARRYWRTNLTLFGLLLLTVIAAALAADKRSGDPATVPFLSRYALNSVLMLGLSYLALLDLHTALMKRLLPWTMAVSMLFCGLSYAATLPYVRAHNRNLTLSMLSSSTLLHEGLHTFLGASPLFSSDILRRSIDGGAYSIPERQIANSLESRPLSVAVHKALVAPLPFTVLDIAENNVSYAFMLQYAAGSTEPKPNVLGVALIEMNDTAHAFEAWALDTFLLHPEFMSDHTPAGTTHFACVRKDRLPAGPLKLALVCMAAGRTHLMETSHTLQNPQPFAPALASIGPALIHEIATYTTTFAGRSGQFVLPTSAHRAVAWPAHYCIEVLARPSLPSLGEPIDIWRTGPLADERRGIRLAVQGDHFIAFAGDGQTWHEAARLQAAPNAWNWIGLSFDGSNMILMQCANNATSGLGPLSVAAGTLPPPLQRAAVLLPDYPIHVDAQAAKIREFRILPALVTPETIAAHWPIFQID